MRQFMCDVSVVQKRNLDDEFTFNGRVCILLNHQINL